MRHPWSIGLLLVGAILPSWEPPGLDCGAGAVLATLTSIVRARVVQVVADSVPASLSDAGKAQLAAATRIAIRAPRLVQWETAAGRLQCIGVVAVAAPASAGGASLKTRTELRYRVVRSQGETFLVDVAYADLMNGFAANDTLPARLPANP